MGEIHTLEALGEHFSPVLQRLASNNRIRTLRLILRFQRTPIKTVRENLLPFGISLESEEGQMVLWFLAPENRDRLKNLMQRAGNYIPPAMDRFLKRELEGDMTRLDLFLALDIIEQVTLYPHRIESILWDYQTLLAIANQRETDLKSLQEIMTQSLQFPASLTSFAPPLSVWVAGESSDQIIRVGDIQRFFISLRESFQERPGILSRIAVAFTAAGLSITNALVSSGPLGNTLDLLQGTPFMTHHDMTWHQKGQTLIHRKTNLTFHKGPLGK